MPKTRASTQLPDKIAPMLHGKKISYADPPQEAAEGEWLSITFTDGSTLYVDKPTYYYDSLASEE